VIHPRFFFSKLASAEPDIKIRDETDYRQYLKFSLQLKLRLNWH
jgi:hypothetical protein